MTNIISRYLPAALVVMGISSYGALAHARGASATENSPPIHVAQPFDNPTSSARTNEDTQPPFYLRAPSPNAAPDNQWELPLGTGLYFDSATDLNDPCNAITLVELPCHATNSDGDTGGNLKIPPLRSETS